MSTSAPTKTPATGQPGTVASARGGADAGKDASKNIDAYIARMPDWQQSIGQRLRTVIHQADPPIAEEWKWNSPAFSHEGLLCFFWSAKNFVKFTFGQGSLLANKQKVFDHESGNDHNRSIRFTDVKEVKDTVIVAYMKEAVAKNLEGHKVVVKEGTRPVIEMSEDIRVTLRGRNLLKAYEARTYYQRNGYLSWIGEAKQEATRQKRVEKMLGTYMPPKADRK